MGRFDINRHEQHGLPTRVSDEHQTRTLTYNGYGELNTSTQRFGSQAVYDYTLTYDDSGTIIGKTESLPDGTTDTYEYGYDLRKRLTSVTKNGTEVERYSYDANGNRLTATSTARGVENQAAMYNAGDQIIQLGDTTYTYDANGRLQTKTQDNEVTTYQYGSTGRLLSVALANGDTITYRHNALGNRVAKLKNGTVVEKYLWQNKTTLLATFDENDTLKQRYEYALGHAPTAFTQGPDRFYIITDQIGSPRFITDESGTIVKAITYDSYGNVVSDTNPALQIPFGFASGLNDPDTDLLRFGYRDYDPQTGRWTARDPIGFAGGDTNLYGYVLGRPIDFEDPDGLSRKKIAEFLFVILEGLLDEQGHIPDSGRLNEPGTPKTEQLEEQKRPNTSDPKKPKSKRDLVIDPFSVSLLLLCETGHMDYGTCEFFGLDTPACPEGFIRDGNACVPGC